MKQKFDASETLRHAGDAVNAVRKAYEGRQVVQLILAANEALEHFKEFSNAFEVAQISEVAMVCADFGYELCGIDELTAAISLCSLSEAIHFALVEMGHQQSRLELASSQMNLANTLAEAGFLDDAISKFRGAVASFTSLSESGEAKARKGLARARMNLGNALSEQGDTEEAVLLYELAASSYAMLIQEGDSGAIQSLANLNLNLSATLLREGRLIEASDQCRRSVDTFTRLAAEQPVKYLPDLGLALMNLGTILVEQDVAPQAVPVYEAAIDSYETMVCSGYRKYSADVAHCRMNLGNALSDCGNFHQAIHAYKQALHTFEQLVQEGKTQYLGDLAQTRMNLALVYFEREEMNVSLQMLEATCEDYKRLVGQGLSQFEVDLARTHMHLGVVHAREERSQASEASYRAALALLEKQFDDGRTQLRGLVSSAYGNLANAYLARGDIENGLAKYEAADATYRQAIEAGATHLKDRAARNLSNWGLTLLQSGSFEPASEIFEESVFLLSGLVNDGKHHHAFEWGEVANLLVTSTLEAVLSRGISHSPQPDYSRQASGTWKRLILALEHLSQLTENGSDSQRKETIRRTWISVNDVWSNRTKLLPIESLLPGALLPVLLTWLDHAADLLSRGRPEYLAAQIDQLRPMLSGCLQMLLELGQPGAVATWHLRTQGLRAQRQVLASGAPSDPELGKLAAMLDEIDQLATILSGQHQAQSLMLPSVDGGIAMRMSALSGGLGDEGELKRQQALQARYNQLKQEADQLEALLASQGRLPKAQRMDLSLIEQGLRAGDRHDRALVLLLPHQAEQMIVCSIQADQDKPAGLHYGVHPTEAGASEVQLRQWVSQLTEAAVRDGRSVRSSLSDEELQAVAQVEPEPIAVEPLRQAWQQLPLVLRPLLARLYQQGVREVHIVPGGDWHLAPWAGTLDECEQDLRVRQYPTAASWWRVMTEPEEQPLTPSRWAALAHDAQHTRHKPLLWVPPELQALQTIWGPQQLQCLSPSEPVWPAQDQDGAQQEVHALVGLGHGGAPAGNWALAGMVIGQDADRRTRYFTALDLHRVRHATRVVMSCCVLGRVQDWIGEPMGLGALAFGLQARLAVGAVVPIADLEGSLLSMALHHAWQGEEQQCLARGQQMDWSGVFHATRRQILAGQWPQGFEQRLVQGFEQLRGPLRQALDEAANGTMPPRQYWANLARQPSPVVQHTAALTYCLG